MFRTFIEWVYFNLVQLLMGIFFLLIAAMLILLINAGNKNEINEKAQFMDYCQSKGYDGQDCEWEYKRWERGK